MKGAGASNRRPAMPNTAMAWASWRGLERWVRRRGHGAQLIAIPAGCATPGAK
jgi:hypothetical protein